MANKNDEPVSKASLADMRRRAAEVRQQLAHRPGPAELLTDQERADEAPFYFVLRGYVRELKRAREAAGMTLAELSQRSGLAVESLSRLETGAVTNPTWKTLGAYAVAVGRRPVLTAESLSKPVTAPAPAPSRPGG